MPENNKTEEFLQKLTPCIERGELEACVEEAARMAREMGIGAGELLKLSFNEGMDKNKNSLAYILALAAEQGLEEQEKWRAYLGAGFAAQNIENFEKALECYKKALYLNPNESSLHFLFACVLYMQNQKSDAEEHFKIAIKLEPKNAKVHALYGIFLLLEKKAEESSTELTLASKLAVNKEDIKLIHVLRGTLNNFFSVINNNLKNYPESSKFASIAGEEYLNAAKTAEGGLKESLLLLGNVLMAKSFVRKVPVQSWYKRLLYRFSKNPNIPELINNLKNASIYYKKASLCAIGEKQDICNACYCTINVFSDILGAMSALINDENPPINKNAWLNSLKQPREIYIINKLNNGVALVDTLEQLINCVDELSNQQASGVNVQDYLKKCYDNLIEVSIKLDGALKVITYQSVNILKDYLRKQGLGFVEEIKPKKTLFDNWWVKATIGAVVTIILNLISNLLYDKNIIAVVWDFIKSLQL